MKQRPAQEILAFIEAAGRMPNSAKKELWVSWLVKQFELRCEATVISAKHSAFSDTVTKADSVKKLAED